MLEIQCENCNQHICIYQKDGSGPLKRMYFDRMNDFSHEKDTLVCPKCSEVLGAKTIYQKENRPAYRLFVGSVAKKIIKS